MTTDVDSTQNDAHKNRQSKKKELHTSTTLNQQTDQEKFISSQLVNFQPNNDDNQPKKSHFSHIIRETYTKAELEDSLLGSSNPCLDDNDTSQDTNTQPRETYTRGELKDSLLGNCDLQPQDTGHEDYNSQNSERCTATEFEDSLLENNNIRQDYSDHKESNNQDKNCKAEFKVHNNKNLPNNRVKSAPKSDTSNITANKINQQQKSTQKKAKSMLYMFIDLNTSFTSPF